MGQQTFRRDLPVGMPGTIEGMGNYRSLPYQNTATSKQAVYTITPPGTVDASTGYQVTIDGTTVTATTGGSTTTAQLGALIYSAIRANGIIYRKLDAALNVSTGVVTLTARTYNTPLTITTNSAVTTNDLTVANTVAVGTDVRIPFGRFVGRLSSYTVDPATGLSPAALISHATNYEMLGVTLKQIYEKDSIGPKAQASYPPQATLEVLSGCSEIKGIWVEAVDADIDMRSHSVYIAVSAGNEGKVTRVSSGAMDISTKARYESNSIIATNSGVPLVLVYFNK